MRDVDPHLGFDLEVGRSGYNLNLVQAPGEDAPGSNSPVTEQENQMLDDDTRAPGSGWPGSEGNAGRPITNRK